MKTTDALKLASIAVAVGAGLWLVSRVVRAGASVASAAGDVLWSVSPTNNENVIYQTANKPVQWLTNDPTATLGGAAYDVTHDGSLNPTSSNNLIYRNIRPGGQSLGGWLYDVFN